MKKKLLTLLALLTTIVSGAWGQTTLFSTNFSTDDGWTTENIITSTTTEATKTIKGKTISFKGYKNSNLSVAVGETSSAAGTLTFTGNNITVSNSTPNYYMAIPLTGVNGSITITYTGNKTGHYYTYDDGNTGSVADRAQGGNNNDRTWTISDLESSDVTFYIGTSGKSITGITITTPTPATAPTITKQPEGGNYATGNVSPLTIEATASAGTLSFQWYSCDDAEKNNEAAISGATDDSFTPTATGFYFCRVTDGNGSTDSDVVEVSISDAEAPTISVTPAAPSVPKNTSVTLTATVTGTPDPTIQWYSNTTASNTGGTAIEGETNTTYSPSTATPGTYYFYAVATNSEDTATSDVVTLTVTGSNACKLLQVIYSNSFDAFITEPKAEVLYEATDEAVINGDANVGDVKTPAANGTVKAYYLEGTSVPTITSTKKSDDATVSTATAGKIIVTAEDGTTTATYDITVEAVSPFEGSSRVFDGTENWVKTGNAFSKTSGKEGWLFSKNDNDWSRESPGKNRIYFFLAPSTSITFENGGTARNIKVYRNGTELSTPTSSGSCTIAGDTENAYMIAVVSNQTSGDGAFKSITVAGSQKESIAIICEGGYASYSCDRALDFSNSGAEAYIIKSTTENSAALTKVTKVPAGTGIIVKGTKGETVNVAIATGTTDDVTGNLLKGTVNTPKDVEKDEAYGLSKADGLFHLMNDGTIPANKAYLLASDVFQSGTAPVLSLEFSNGDVTAIDDVRSKMEEVRGDFYNLNGQRVAQPTKGLYIVNGKKVIMK